MANVAELAYFNNGPGMGIYFYSLHFYIAHTEFKVYMVTTET